MLKKIYTSLQRKRSRKQSLEKIRQSEQFNYNVINLHRLNIHNVGDYYSAPHHYFESLKNTAVDIYGYRQIDQKKLNQFVEKINNNSIIIGGGGLLNRGSFEKQMKTLQLLTEKNKKTVIWGAGHNSKKRSDFKKLDSYNIDISKFGLVGTRDFSAPGQFVPCVSCLHPVFEKEYETKHEVGIIFHEKSLKNKKLLEKFSNLPNSANTESIEDLSAFIGSCEGIITNSYHAMYWSILLNKKVTVVPNSSKFFDFKYQPNFSSFENALEDHQKAKVYSGVREECIEINQNFYQKVADYLDLE